MAYLLEIAAFTIEAALQAQQAGADRIELCDNPPEGGTTPSVGMLQVARENLEIDLFPIIRPRGGDFLYSDHEFEIMKRDIITCKSLGCDGVVLGLLTADGKVDYERTARLAELAYPLELTFHRAFDRVQDPFAAMETLIELGFHRILTSGLKPTAPEGAALIRELISKADGRICIMPGSGVRDSNLAQLMQDTGATEYHTAARTSLPSLMHYSNSAMNENNATTGIDSEMIRRMRQYLNQSGAVADIP